MIDLSHHRLQSLTDDSWIKQYAKSMGEDKLYEYKNKVYQQLLSLKVGQSISIIEWVKPENYDLFIKIADCFMSETNGCYYFYKNYTIIKHTFDAEEMEKTCQLLRAKHQQQVSGSDGRGIESGSGESSPVPSSPQEVQISKSQ